MSDRLNVLLVVLDCARADHVSCYGHSRETTPFLDQLAREGVRFAQMIATAPGTLPSHASLFTGLYPVTHGATDERCLLSAGHRTLAQYLKAAGYRTAAFCTNPWVSPETGSGCGYDAFFTQRQQSRLAARAVRYGRKASDTLLRRHDSGARRTNQALRQWLAARDQPFFAFVHYNETRLRCHLPPPYERLFMPKEFSAARVRAVNQDSDRYIARQVEMNEEDFVILRALYDGALRYVDSRLREVADFLRARGAWDQTLCIVTSDHGVNLGEHGMMSHKFVLYDTVLRVPLLVRCPPRVPQGFVVEELAQSTDILPTVLRLLEVPEETGKVQGRPLLDGGRAIAGPDCTISERFRPDLSAFQRRFPAYDTRPFAVRQKAVRTKREKFIWHSDEANEFYDLIADPGEEHNLIDREVERADSLRQQLFDWFAAVEKFEPDGPAPEFDGLIRRRLQGLGYIE